jgi:hypothetical protein
MNISQLRAIYLIEANLIIGLSTLVECAVRADASVIEAVRCEVMLNGDGSIRVTWSVNKNEAGTMIYKGSYLGVM